MKTYSSILIKKGSKILNDLDTIGNKTNTTQMEFNEKSIDFSHVKYFFIITDDLR